MASPRLFAVLLAGGFGTRFWPASRRSLPKQFLAIGSRRTLIAQTAARMRGLASLDDTFVVTSHEHVARVRRSLSKIPPENVLGEPVGRNTAAAVAWAAREIERRAPESVQIVLPSDHVIQPLASFRKAVRAAVEQAAREPSLLTFGIRPTSPATGYGYIEAGARVSDANGLAVHAVARFVEKPERARAEQFLASGRFFWNAGIFVWSTRAIVTALARHAPATWNPIAAAPPGDVARAYADLPAESIDVAVLEKASNVRVLPIDFTWSDVGSWAALADVEPLDANGNCLAGGTRLVAEDAHRCIVYGKRGEAIALVGVDDLIVVHAGKATLVCSRERAQDVKKIVAALEKDDPSFL